MSTESARPRFSAGVARRKVNPVEPVWLAGYGFRTSPSCGIISELFVRALAIEEGNQNRSLVLSIDHLGMGRELVETLAAQLGQRLGIARERLLIAFSHTHSAPVVDDTLSDIYPMTASDRDAVERYCRFLLIEIAEVAEQAFSNLAPAQLHYGKAVAGVGVNRRRIRPGCDYFPAPVDHDVPILKVADEADKIIALVYGYACHSTTLGLSQTSADYPGFASQELEETYPGAVCLYIAGCGADINPLPRGTPELAAAYGGILAAAVREACQGPDLTAITAPIHAVREEVSLPMEPCPDQATLEYLAANSDPITRRWAQRWRGALKAQEAIPTSCLYPIHIWRFGPVLTWVILAAEVCTDYSLRIKAALGPEKTWVSAYCNELIGYIPSERLLIEGGYEGGASKVVFGLPGEFKPGVEEVIVGATLRLARTTSEAQAKLS